MEDTETKFIGVERFDHWLLFGEYCQLHEDQGSRSSSCPINDFQVCQEDKEDEVFKVFVLLAWEISDFKDELEDEFVSSGGV